VDHTISAQIQVGNILSVISCNIYADCFGNFYLVFILRNLEQGVCVFTFGSMFPTRMETHVAITLFVTNIINYILFSRKLFSQ
jgi:hypothetical protein